MVEERQYSDATLLEELRRLAEEAGRPPTQARMDATGAFSSDLYRRRFSSWNDALRAAGLSDRPHRYTEQELIDAIKTVAAELGEPPTVEQMAAHGDVDPSTVRRRFGSWAAGLRRAGFEPEQSRDAYDREALRSHLRSLALAIGRPPTRSETRHAPGPAPETFDRAFAGYADAMEAAGFVGEFDSPRGLIHREYDEPDLVEYLRTLAAGVEGTVSWHDFSFHDGPDRSVLLEHFPSYPAALEAADLITVHPVEPEDPIGGAGRAVSR